MSAKNIKIAYLLSFLSELYFPISIWLFYYLRYLSFQQLAILVTIRLVCSNIFEVPTGVFADKFGRKISVTIYFILYAAVMAGVALSKTFLVFAFLEVLKSLANAFMSGSLEALVYDSLKESGEEKRYDKVVSNIESIQWVGYFLASIVAGYLYFLHPTIPFWIQACLCIFGAIVSLKLFEVTSRTPNNDHWFWQNTAGFKELFNNLHITKLVVPLVLVGSGYLLAAEMLGISQAREYGLDSRGVGWLFGAGYIISAIASQAYPKLRQKFGINILMIATSAILLISFLAAKYVGVLLGCVLIISRIGRSTTFRNLRSSLVNASIHSKYRATTLSTLSLITQLPVALTAIWAGEIIDKTSPNNLALFVGVILTLLILLQLIIFQVVKRPAVITD